MLLFLGFAMHWTGGIVNNIVAFLIRSRTYVEAGLFSLFLMLSTIERRRSAAESWTT